MERLEDRVCLSTLSAGSDSLFIGDAKDNAVKAFDAGTGSFQGTFVSSASGGLHGPIGIIFDHSGNLLVSNQNVNLPINGDVLRYDGTTGAFDNQVISPSDPHAPFAPRSIVLGPDDTLYVADLVASDNVSDGKIEEYQYNETTGTATFKAEIDNPGGLPSDLSGFHPQGLVFGPDGMLYVSAQNIPSNLGGAILRFNPKSGAYLGAFADSNATNDLQRPFGLVFGPDGNLYVTSFQATSSDTDKIEVFAGPGQPQPGSFLGAIDLDQGGKDRSYAEALLFGPGGDLFVPITGNSPHTTGQVRRDDVSTGTYDVFITSAHLGQPWFLTFRGTDPATLDYTTETDAATSQAVRAGTGMVSQAVAAAQPATPDLAPIAPLTDQDLIGVNLLHPHQRRPAS